MDAILLAADASSPDDVWVVGSSDPFGVSIAGLVLHWDGVHWAQETIEGIAHLYDVAVIASDDAWALGSPRDIDNDDDWLVHWDGRRWSRVEHSLKWELVSPSAIAAVATDDVWLVGIDFGASGSQPAPYIAHWDGARWSRSKVSVRSGLLEDVSAFSADSVWAAGYASLDEFDQKSGSVVLRWDGNEWLQVATPMTLMDRTTSPRQTPMRHGSSRTTSSANQRRYGAGTDAHGRRRCSRSRTSPS